MSLVNYRLMFLWLRIG